MRSHLPTDWVRPLAITLVVLATACYSGAKESAAPGSLGGLPGCDTPGLNNMTPCVGGVGCAAKCTKCIASQAGQNVKLCLVNSGNANCAFPCMPGNNDTVPNACIPD
jgi:hypothetical protein